MSAQLVLPQAPIGIEPGGQAWCDVRVHNTALASDRFTFEVIGTAVSWATVTPPALALGPEETGVVRVGFHPPRAAHVRAGHSPFALLATSERDGSSALAEQLLAVHAFFDVSFELEPRAQRRRSARHQLRMANRGNETVRLRLAGRSPDRALSVVCAPAELVVHPGTIEYAHVQVRFSGPPAEPLTFQVIGHTHGHEDPLLAAGTLAPRPSRFGRRPR